MKERNRNRKDQISLEHKIENGIQRLLGHITAFSILFPLAIQRLWSSLSLQARSTPSVPFNPKPWYFSDSDHLLRRNAAIYLSLLLLLPITVFASLPPISTRHVASLILFFLLLLSILLADSHRFLLLPDGALFFLSAFAFLADSALSNPNSTQLSEVDSHLRWLTAGPTVACAITCIVLAFISSSAADVALSIALALKGSWELQVGLTFYVLTLEAERLFHCGWGQVRVTRRCDEGNAHAGFALFCPCSCDRVCVSWDAMDCCHVDKSDG